jgi:hypothetical protein
MRDGGERVLVDGWLTSIESTMDATPVDNARSEVAPRHWLEEMAERREGRRARLAEAASGIPAPVWLMLILGAGLTVLYLIVFADRRGAGGFKAR